MTLTSIKKKFFNNTFAKKKKKKIPVLYPSRQEAYQHRSKYMKVEFLIAAHDMKDRKQADAVFFKLICSGVELIYNVISFCCIAKRSSCTYMYVLLLFTH